MSAENNANGDVVDVLVERIRRAIDPGLPVEEQAATTARILADVLRRRAAAAALADAGWARGGAGG